jgi:lysophospholipid acyltransferase (LPLAT)-like uncharacterized protein
MLENVKQSIFKGMADVVAPPLLKLLTGSQEYHVENQHHLEEVSGRSQNFILAFWHGQMLPTLFYFTRSFFDQSTFYTFISPHRDGEYITRAADGLGINALRTSLRDRRLEALKKVFKIVRQGKNLAVTPDGPIGPAFEAKTGIVRLSRRFGMPVLPVAALPSSAKIFDSWDHFVLPYPCGRVEVEFAEPMKFDSDRSDSEVARELESTLVSLGRKVGRRSEIGSNYLRYLPD